MGSFGHISAVNANKKLPLLLINAISPDGMKNINQSKTATPSIFLKHFYKETK